MTAQRIRSLRHWKQRFDPNAAFVWRKNVIWAGEQMEAGMEIPEELAANRTKLKRFWESGYIELAEFEEPDVLTGQVPEKTKEEETDESETSKTGEADETETKTDTSSEAATDSTSETKTEDDDSWLGEEGTDTKKE